jgi:hypothetical protein
VAKPLSEDLFNQLQGAPLARLSQQLGLPQAQTEQAVSTALPLLLGALGRNASQPQGANALYGALQRDHSGLELHDVLRSVLGGGGGEGASILGHVFGPRQQVAAQGLGAATGLNSDRASMLLRLLAPIVLAYLAQRVFAQRTSATPSATTDTTAASPAVLGSVLGEEQQQVRTQGGTVGRLLSAVLDRDGDGDVDLADLRPPSARDGSQPRARPGL